MHRVQCRTLFDITQTDTRHQFSQARLPFQDAAGRLIVDHRAWMLSRNQQRNWETVLQILGMRVQPQDCTRPHLMYAHDAWWAFQFSVEDSQAFCLGDRPYGQLEQDATMVPMLIGLTEQVQITPMLIPGINIVFEPATP